MAKYWMGPAPLECDTCDAPITTKFYDAAASFGRWATMCPSCHHLGPGLDRLGQGRGQEYTKQPDGRYLKTAG